MPSLMQQIFGESSRPKVHSGFTKDQQRMLNQYMSMIQNQRQAIQPLQDQAFSYLQGLFEPGAFQGLEGVAKRQFNEEIVPGIAERFGASAGSGGENSAMANALGRAGVDLETNLAQLRQQGQMGALGQMLGLSQMPFQNYAQGLGLWSGQNIAPTPRPGFLQGVAGGFGQGLGQALGRLPFGGF